jgi:hypothetical protein
MRFLPLLSSPPLLCLSYFSFAVSVSKENYKKFGGNIMTKLLNFFKTY